MDQIKKYYERFETDGNILEKLFNKTNTGNNTYQDIFFQEINTESLTLEDNKVSRAFSAIDKGAGIRVVDVDRTGYSFTENTDFKSLRKAAGFALAISGNNRTLPPSQVKPEVSNNNFYKSDILWENLDIREKIDFLNRLNNKIYSTDNRIVNVKISFSHESSYKLIICSDGSEAFDFQPLFALRISCTAQMKNKRETNTFALSGRYGAEYLKNLDIDKIAEETVRRTVILFEAEKTEPGEQALVLSAGSSGILLHEAIGHGLEADFNRKGISIFSGMLNKQIAAPFVTIVDDATIPGSRGSINIDDEGTPGQKTILVDNGVLTGFMHDKISAGHFGVKPTGNGRRESFRHPPIPRMRTTYMLPGPHSKDEIIESIKNGIYAESFTNGQVFIGAGDFTFYVKSGYKIENGKLTHPVKDINLIGTGPDVLSKISMVADDLKIDNSTWTCGKDGQDVPVSLGHPTIKVSSITVGTSG